MNTERVKTNIGLALSRRRVARTVVVALVATLLQIIGGSLQTASAAGTPAVSMPAGGWVISQSATTTISGASVSGLGAADTYLITIALTGSVNGATLKLPTTTNLTASYGYTSGSNTFASFTKISFTGIAADVNNALAAMQYVAGTAAVSGTTPTIAISAVENISGLAYNPANNHYYKAYQYGASGVAVGTDITDRKQSTAITWAGTKSFAGQSGYLVTITTATEDSFTSQTIPSAQNIWIGAKDNWAGGIYTFGEGYWGWVSPGAPEYGAGFMRDSAGVTIDANGRYVSTTRSTSTSYTSTNAGVTTTGSGGGSSNGYFNWCANEPNNAYNTVGEHSAVTNWGGGTCWNDLHEDNNSSVSGFVVEWGTNAADGGFTNAASTSAKVYVAPTLTIVTGNNQIARVSTAVSDSITVLFRDSMSTAIPNATISWAATRGTRSAATSSTNASGNASQSQWTMPATTGVDTLTASYSGAGNPSVSFLARVGSFPLTNGDTDTALTFGSGKYAWKADDNSLDIANAISIEAWVYQTSLIGSGWNMVLNKEGSYQLGTINGSWGYALSGSGGYLGVNTGVAPTLNQWQHIAFTRSLNTNTVNFYVDGQLRYTGTADGAGTGAITNSTYPLTIGGRSSDGVTFTTPFAGQIDEVRVYRSARTATEIRTDMHTYGPVDNSDLALFYDFNEGSGSTLYNRKSGATPVSDLNIVSANEWNDIKVTSVDATYSTIEFSRSYLTSAGGWKIPASVTRLAAIVTAGGGGGGAETDATGWFGGGGGAGGYQLVTATVSSGAVQRVTVGQGGRSGVSTASANADTGIPTNGQDSIFGSTISLGGGAGAGRSSNARQNGLAGGSGGGGGTYSGNGGLGTSGQGNNGGASSAFCCVSGGGGGAGGLGGTGVSTGDNGTGGAAGNGVLNPMYIAGITAQYLAAGGAGGGRTTNGAVGSMGGVAFTASASPNTGSGGGGGGGNVYVAGGYGGSGVVIVRWINAAVPSYTKPVNTNINVGMTETFTTNVTQDSATVTLTRTFRWESTTGGANGTFSLIKQGTGASNAFFSWVPSDTSTSGSNFLYRLIVTDSDTAGLFITDSSTAFAVINGAMRLTSKSTITKTVGVTKIETFTVSFGTPSYTYALSPDHAFFWIDTTTATTPRIRIADTATVGTYYETFTVTDSVSARITVPLTIIVSPPPSFSASAAQVDSGTVLYLDAANSVSYPGSGTTWSDISGRGLSGTLTFSSGTSVVNANGTTRTGTQYFNGVNCVAPSFNSEANGALVFNGSSTCGYVPGVGYNPNYTYEVWIKRNGSQAASATVITNTFRFDGDQVNMSLIWSGGTGLIAGIYASTWSSTPVIQIPNATWTHVAATYNGTTLSLIVNGETTTTVNRTIAWDTSRLDGGLMFGRKWDGADTFNGSLSSVRVYSRVLSIAEIQQNYNSTKNRFFGTTNENVIAQKYASKFVDTYTVTAGSESITATFTNNALSGVKWDTSTARSLVLTLQDTLTPGTYYDTITATDIYGVSSRLPLTFTIAKADTLTVYIDTPTALSYTGSQARFTQSLKVVGLVGLETGTITSATVKFKPSGSTCATGGYCRVGDIGPAGGIIFIDTSTASSDGRIYEAAPQNWSGSDDLATVAQFCTAGAAATANIANGSQVGIGWGDTLTANFDAGCSGGAAQVAADLVLNGYTDWFVPSENEAVNLYTYREQVGLIQLGSNWTAGNWGYWTSTESSAGVMRIISNASGWSIGNGNKNEATRLMLRPVRAFKSCWAIDTCTALATTDTPTVGGIYQIVPSALAVGAGSLNNYVAINYLPTNLTINKVAPTPIVLPWVNTGYPDTFTVNFPITTTSGNFKLTTTNGSASGCAFDYRKIYTTSQGTCTVTISRAATRNFTADTATATVFFLTFVNNQPLTQEGSGSGIALSGVTSFETSTVSPPSIASLSTTLLSLGSGGTFTITGTGFNTGGLTVKFWRNKYVTPSGSTATTITFNVSDIGSSGAASGRIAVTTVNGEVISVDSLAITP